MTRADLFGDSHFWWHRLRLEGALGDNCSPEPSRLEAEAPSWGHSRGAAQLEWARGWRVGPRRALHLVPVSTCWGRSSGHVSGTVPFGRKKGVQTHILGHLDEGKGILCGLSWQHAGAEGRRQGAQASGWQDLPLQRTHRASGVTHWKPPCSWGTTCVARLLSTLLSPLPHPGPVSTCTGLQGQQSQGGRAWWCHSWWLQLT